MPDPPFHNRDEFLVWNCSYSYSKMRLQSQDVDPLLRLLNILADYIIGPSCQTNVNQGYKRITKDFLFTLVKVKITPLALTTAPSGLHACLLLLLLNHTFTWKRPLSSVEFLMVSCITVFVKSFTPFYYLYYPISLFSVLDMMCLIIYCPSNISSL